MDGFIGDGFYCYDGLNCIDDACQRGTCEELTPGYRLNYFNL